MLLNSALPLTCTHIYAFSIHHTSTTLHISLWQHSLELCRVMRIVLGGTIWNQFLSSAPQTCCCFYCELGRRVSLNFLKVFTRVVPNGFFFSILSFTFFHLLLCHTMHIWFIWIDHMRRRAMCRFYEIGDTLPNQTQHSQYSKAMGIWAWLCRGTIHNWIVTQPPAPHM